MAITDRTVVSEPFARSSRKTPLSISYSISPPFSRPLIFSNVSASRLLNSILSAGPELLPAQNRLNSFPVMAKLMMA
ncbi:hypothetical protein [Candidatus Methanoprimaticola sp. MG2]|uniref:hypothetical protein n=1 Tax=Candidatus Methanoprimaticola sp. MG2 TaxID=3228838 RepID=UPI0039C6BE77